MSEVWKPDRIVRLRGMVLDGMTAAEIAAELAITRNAVIGQCNRLGLKLQTPACAPMRVETPVRKSPPVVVFLQDAQSGQCRWPMWEDQGPVPRHPEICGSEVVRGSYCGPHAVAAYQKTGGVK